MRTLLGLTTLMLVLAAAVWWKTRAADDPSNLPPTTSSNSAEGVVTVGMKPAGSAESRNSRLGGGTFEEAASRTEPVRRGKADWSESRGDEAPKTPQGNDYLSGNQGTENPVPGPGAEPAVDPDPTPPTSPVAKDFVYQVAPGDTLYRIVVRHYGTAPESLVDAVAKANGLSDPSRIAVGDDLKLPTVPGFAAPQRP